MITAEQLRCRVRQIINEIDDDSAVTLLSDDTKALDEHIAALLPDAVLLVQKNKRHGILNPKSAITVAMPTAENGSGTGYIILPDDFVELISVQMKGWSRPCTVLYGSDSQVANMQYNSYTRSGGARPVCSEDVLITGQRCMRYWWLPKDMQPVVEHFIYEVKYNAKDGLSGNDEALHSAVAYYCAALLMNIFGRGDMSVSFFNVASALCGNVEKGNKKH